MADSPRIESRIPGQLPASVNRPNQLPGNREGASSGNPEKRIKRNPFDITAAMDRLAKLLARDGDQPRSDVPAKGYYLNIVV